MREITWRLNRARIWLNELPDWSYEAALVAECQLPAHRMRNENTRYAGVEMFIPAGGMVMYGGLGAIFVPEQTENLLVQVLVSADQGKLFHGMFAVESEITYIGFPKEYSEGLLESVAQFAGTQKLGTGRLSFCRAIHGEVGSSINLFQIVSRAVIRLLCLNNQSLSDKELLELLL